MSILIIFFLFGLFQTSVWCIALSNDSCEGHTNGQSWEPESCINCTCVNGRKECLGHMCNTSCDDPVQQEGECCPPCLPNIDNECDGHLEGETWNVGSCESCTCRDGKKNCISPVCNGSCSNPKEQNDDCCPGCPSRRHNFCEGYSEDESWKEGPCTTCTCQRGGKFCHVHC